MTNMSGAVSRYAVFDSEDMARAVCRGLEQIRDMLDMQYSNHAYTNVSFRVVEI